MTRLDRLLFAFCILFARVRIFIRYKWHHLAFLHPVSMLFYRLVYGSMGIEFWSAGNLIVWPGIFLIFPPQGIATSPVGWLIRAYWPYAPLVMLSFGIAHFVILALPSHLLTVAIRKAICIPAIVLWLEVARALFEMSMPAIGSSILFMAGMLSLAITRRSY